MTATLTARPDATTGKDLPRPGGWSITWRGTVYRDTDVTGQHLATLALISGTDDYASLDIDPRHGHQRLMMMLTAFVAVAATAGIDTADPDRIAAEIASAINGVSTATADDILGSLSFN
jgi:hypothetical protein